MAVSVSFLVLKVCQNKAKADAIKVIPKMIKKRVSSRRKIAPTKVMGILVMINGKISLKEINLFL